MKATITKRLPVLVIFWLVFGAMLTIMFGVNGGSAQRFATWCAMVVVCFGLAKCRRCFTRGSARRTQA